MKLKAKNQLTVTRIAILGTEKLNNWKSNELDLIALSLGKLRSDLWNEFGSLKAWGISKSKLTSKVNQRANYKQLTLFDQGLTTLFVYPLKFMGGCGSQQISHL